MAPKVTAVVVAYWPSRFESIPSIVEDLLAGTRVPDHIIVLNNNHRELLADIPGASVINCGWNYTSRGKYAAAMLEPSDYYLLLDDDVSVKGECLDHFLSFAHDECCLSDVGRVMLSNFCSAGRVVKGVSMTGKPHLVDIFIGSIQFVSFRAIVRMLEMEAEIRLPRLPMFRSVGEDILIAMANPTAAVVATTGLKNRSAKTQGVAAMQHDYGYYTIRDLFGYHAWLATGHRPFLGPVPGDKPADQKRVRDYVGAMNRRDETGENMENMQ